jgi:hypothetical protein
MLLRDFVAGFVTAIAPGYLSHLCLDATTPMGLPLLLKSEPRTRALLVVLFERAERVGERARRALQRRSQRVE